MASITTTAPDFDRISVRQTQLSVGKVTEDACATTKCTRDVIASFLARCKIPYPKVPYDLGFEAAVQAEGARFGYPIKGPSSEVGLYIPLGVSMATTAYAHLPSQSTQIFICLYTAFLTYLDDAYHTDIEGVKKFNERFVQRQPQGDAVLDSLAHLLLQIPQHYSEVVSNLMMTSSLNLINALLLEHETQNMTVHSSAKGYPIFSRTLSGAPEAYALFQFPKELPLKSYIQALPELITFIDNGNDILSFYKEELDDEAVNYISLLADSQDTTKHEALRRVEDETVEAHDRVVQILAPYKEASECFLAFSHGYVGFHAAAKRYRLDELKL